MSLMTITMHILVDNANLLNRVSMHVYPMPIAE